MSRTFPNTVEGQRFFEAVIHKEDDSRMSWYYKQKATNPEFGMSKQKEVFIRRIERMKHSTSDDLIQRCKNMQPQDFRMRKPRNYTDEYLMQLPETLGSDLPPLMRPPPAETKKLLYDGISKDGEGRANYLKHRKMDGPEDKYEMPVAVSWVHGWGFREFFPPESIKKPEHGRTRKIGDTFYTRNSLMKLLPYSDSNLVLPRVPSSS